MKKRIAIILPTLLHSIDRLVIRGVQTSLDPKRYSCLFMPIGYLPVAEQFTAKDLWLIKQIPSLDIDGVVLYGGGVGYKTSPQVMEQLIEAIGDLPIINVGSILPGIPSVLVDNFNGMYQLAKHVLRQGCKDILYIDGPKENYDSRQRYKALSKALNEHDLFLPEQQHLMGDMTTACAANLCKQWLNQHKRIPDAIMCVNDLSAKGVIEELERQQISIPDQVKVTGFDDFEYADAIKPSLTTAMYPAQRTGTLAAQLIDELLNGGQLESQYQLETMAIMRASTGDPVHETSPRSHDELQRQLIQQRDSNAQRLAVTSLLHQRATLEQVLLNAQGTLAELGIPELYIYQQSFDDYGRAKICLSHNLHSNVLPIGESQRSLPTAFEKEVSDDLHRGLWVLTELKNDRHHFGYLVALVEGVHAEFIEFISPQIADIIDHQRLLEETKQYQTQVELSEKMAALGGLVSGVAHEINTPLGNTLLAASHLKEQINQLAQQASNQQLTKANFEHFVEQASNTSDIISNSARRAAELITNFKQVAVDQSYEEQRIINLADYIVKVLDSLQHQLTGTQVNLATDLDPDIMVTTFPGAIAQVITNLFANALMHGFEGGKRAGTISIDLQTRRGYHSLTVTDNGKGATQETLNHIFEPFYTTARVNGGCGLGMHIVYNIITQKLNWQQSVVTQPEQGFCFEIKIPLNAGHS
ncbi:substrate-binding domain-containing protein [Agarivorans sp. MS3-6]|uniref:substrate-binding domain-containing protein n=1 Tax=Agarivorans sp. TSD2052 TaxID=2937286 RepID=UPI00200D9E35|nr:substrate-binding domain-containing protein [Agarivorans sp. TSD2052]UPW18740.1 substrate-binding domain-containing protein [Agarivorans sp. TSD2052]